MSSFNYHSRSREEKIRRLIGFSVLLLIFCFLGEVLLTPLAEPVNFLAHPIWRLGEGLNVGVQTFGDFFHNHNFLANENRRLSEENAKLRAILLSKDQVEKDNVYLRRLFGQAESSVKPIVGQVVFLPNFVPYQTLMIDIGLKNSSRPINVGALVTTDSSVLVGRVSVVGQRSSKVKLLSAESNLAVLVGKDNLSAVANGAGTGNYTITLPRNAGINIGDRVTASQFNNYLIGVVGHIVKNPNQPNQTVLVKTPINLWQLKWLEIYDTL